MARQIASTQIDWLPIDVAPQTEGRYLLGFDENSAKAHGNVQAGLCLIRWVDADEEDDFDAGWEVQPFAEALDVSLDARVTHFAQLPFIVLA